LGREVSEFIGRVGLNCLEIWVLCNLVFNEWYGWVVWDWRKLKNVMKVWMWLYADWTYKAH
jgi:hypothetical protein